MKLRKSGRNPTLDSFIFLLAVALFLSGACSADINMGEEEPNGTQFLGIWFGYQPNLVESGTTLSWTHEIETEVNDLDTTNYADVTESWAVAIIPKDSYEANKGHIDWWINRIDSSYFNWHEHLIADYRDAWNAKDVFNVFVFPDPDFAPIVGAQQHSWQTPTSFSIPMNFVVSSDALMGEYRLLGVACVSRSWAWGVSKRTVCRFAWADTIIYDCDICGADICLLDYIHGNDDAIQGFYNQFGGDICIRKGSEHGFCEDTGDCKSMATQPSYDLGGVTPGVEPYYGFEAVRCEKGRGEVGDARIDYINLYLFGGGKGTCEFGAEIPVQCEEIFGSPSSYRIITTDNAINYQRSYWAVDNGKCVLGECNSFSACYDLYNSIYYECMPKTVYTNNIPSQYGVCQQRQWTTGLIQQKCEEGEGRVPREGYAWFVNEAGECYEDRPTISECNVASDCDCPPGTTPLCQKIQTTMGEIGVCACQEAGGGITYRFCGDGICDINEFGQEETMDNCPIDCGYPPPHVNGDGDGLPDWLWYLIFGVGGLIFFLIVGVGLILVYLALRKK